MSVAEKFSQVLQAYQVENQYGSTIEAYTDVIELEGAQRQVDLLKWGRVALVFQTPDAEMTGVWDNESRGWVILDDEYTNGVRDALRIARKTQTADLVKLPVRAAGGVTMKKVWILAAAFAVSMVGTVQAEEEIQAKSLAELLQLVKDGKVVNQRVNEQREREFVAGKNRQQQALRDAEREQANEEARSERLEAQFERNEQTLLLNKKF